MYALQSMLSIRSRRRDRSQSELAGARMAQVQAERERDAKRETSESFEAGKEARRDDLYAAVIGRPVSLDAIDQVRSAVTRIDEESLLLKEAVRQAEDVVEKRVGETEQARVRFVSATKDLTKIEEHRSLWLEEERREEEHQADLEMEEFTGRKEDDDGCDSNA